MIQYVTRGEYDAAYFRLITTDNDPPLNSDFWLSSGSAHMWNPSQRAPATAWEADVDRLMTQLTTTVDPTRRHALFVQVQTIAARELPALCFAYPRLWYAISRRITGATPAAFRPPLLWNPADLGVGDGQAVGQ